MKPFSPLFIAAWFLSALSTAAAERVYYTSDNFPADSVFAVDTSSSAVAIEARCALRVSRESGGEGRYWWGLAWDCMPSGDFSYVILRPRNTDYGDFSDRRVVDVEYGAAKSGEMSVIERTTAESGINGGKGFNTLLVEWTGGNTVVYAGSGSLKKMLELPTGIPVQPQCRLISSDGVNVASVVVECVADKAAALDAGYDMDGVRRRLAASTDPMEGVWSYLDRETDDSRARPGGFYTLVVLRAGDGYDVLYLDGAKVNAGGWHSLMLKGRLTAMPFERHFNLVWYDSMMEPLARESFCTLSAEGVLSFEFPLYRSRMRFYRSGVSL